MEFRSAFRLNALLFLFLLAQCAHTTAFVRSARISYLQPEMPRVAFVTSSNFRKPAMCASKSTLIHGMGSLSLGEAIASPMVVALHSGRFSAMQKAICRIPGTASYVLHHHYFAASCPCYDSSTSFCLFTASAVTALIFVVYQISCCHFVTFLFK